MCVKEKKGGVWAVQTHTEDGNARLEVAGRQTHKVDQRSPQSPTADLRWRSGEGEEMGV